MAAHLKLCNAYVLYCNFCWNRSFVSLIAKRFFKKVAKELEETRIFNANEIDGDSEILMALQDQVCFKKYECAKSCIFRSRFLALLNVHDFAGSNNVIMRIARILFYH